MNAAGVISNRAAEYGQVCYGLLNPDPYAVIEHNRRSGEIYVSRVIAEDAGRSIFCDLRIL